MIVLLIVKSNRSHVGSNAFLIWNVLSLYFKKFNCHPINYALEGHSLLFSPQGPEAVNSNVMFTLAVAKRQSAYEIRAFCSHLNQQKML